MPQLPERRERKVEFSLRRANRKERTVEASISSEEPYARPWGLEILDHDAGSVDFSRARGGSIPLLSDHDVSEVPRPGNLEGLRIGLDRKLRGVLRFADTERGRDLWAAVEGGFLGEMSIGYNVLSIKNEGHDTETGQPIFRVTRWQPLEASLVNVPADATVGVGRSASGRSRVQMPEVHESREERIEAGSGLARSAQAEDATTLERNRVSEMNAIAQHHPELREMADYAIRKGTPLEQFRREAMDGLRKSAGPGLTCVSDARGDEGLGLDHRDRSRYSICRAVNALASKDWSGAEFEREVSQAASRKYRKETEGLLVPIDVLGHRTRGLTAGDPDAGGYLVAQEQLGGQFIDALRNVSVVMQAGATALPGLQGNVTIPRLDAGATAYWVSENQDVTASDPTFGQVGLTPKTLGGIVEFSRRLLLQSSPAVEQIVRNDLLMTLGTAIDRAALAGSGVGGEPLGVLYTPGIGDVAGATDGLAPGYGHIVKLGTEVAIDNALLGSLAYITNAAVQGKLHNTEKSNGTGLFVWEDARQANAQGSLGGYPAFVSNNVPSDLVKGNGENLSAILFGNWADVLIGQWGALELLSNPYTKFASGAVQVRALADVDVNVRHPQSFAAMKDAITTLP